MALALGGAEGLPEVAAAGRPTSRRGRGRATSAQRSCWAPWSSPKWYAAAAWSARTPTEPSTRRSSTGCSRTRSARRRAGFSQGWAFLRLDTPEDLDRFWAATSPPSPAWPWSTRTRPESRWLRGMRTAPVVIVPLSNREAYLDRYAEPDKGWTDRDEARWPVPYWHIDTGDGRAADPADRRRRGPGRLLLRHPAGPDRGLPGRVRRAGGVHPDRRDHRRPPHRGHRPRGLGRRAAGVRRTRSCIAGVGDTPPVHRLARSRSTSRARRPSRIPDSIR